MVINEIFYSIQGEGLLAGVPSVFIRLAGCPLHCDWCDTKYAWDPNAGVEMTVDQVIDKVQQWRCRYVVLTGGEPMTNPQLPELANELKKLNKHITIETAGIAFIEGLSCDLMSVSPKLSNAGQKPAKKVPDAFSAARQLISRFRYQLKFVVEAAEDLPEIRQAVESLGDVDPTRVLLMPQARTRDELLTRAPMVAELCKQTGFTFCNRLQVLLYDGARGK